MAARLHKQIHGKRFLATDHDTRFIFCGRDMIVRIKDAYITRKSAHGPGGQYEFRNVTIARYTLKEKKR